MKGLLSPVLGSLLAGACRETRSSSAWQPILAALLGPALLFPVTAHAQIQSGALDKTFTPAITNQSFVQILSLLALPGNKTLVGGSFAKVDGVARSGIAQLNSDGTLDPAFDPGTGISGGFGTVNVIVIQPADGNVLVGGDFTSFNGTARKRIVRLSPGGTVDTNFNPGLGFDGTVSALAVQADGKILVGGRFSNAIGIPHASIARLNTDGTLDASFKGVADGQVNAIVAVGDHVLIGGRFATVSGKQRPWLARLNALDGSLDLAFTNAPSDFVNSLVVQPDLRVLVGGGFTNLGPANLFGIARLNADGSVDGGFQPSLDYQPFGSVFSIAVQSDSKIIIGGNFSSVGGVSRPSLARFRVNGSLDTGWTPDPPNTAVQAMAVQVDGKLLVGGSFSITSTDGQTQYWLARLWGDSVVSLSPSLSDIKMLPNGAVQFMVNGEVGRSYIIQALANFAASPAWANISTQLQATAAQPYVDSAASGFPQRFYRAELKP